MGASKLKINSEVISAVKELRENTFLRHFSKRFINDLTLLGTVEVLEPNIKVTAEGQMTSQLYILLSGELEVRVGGERVTALHAKGEVIGEMSLIAGAKCTATVETTKKCRVISFQHKDLRELLLKSDHEYLAEFYKAFSKVLTERIVKTNEKARKFELTNAELTKLHREIDEINQKRLEEIAFEKKMTFKKVEEVYNKNIVPLFDDLKDVTGPLSAEDAFSIKKQVTETTEVLKPLIANYSTEQSLADKRVLLVESDRKQQRIAKMALRGSGLGLDLASNKAEAEQLLRDKKYDILLVTEDMLEVTELAHQVNKEMEQVIMTSKSVSTYIQYFEDHPYLTNIVSRNEEDRAFTIKNIFSTVGKLANDDIFGMEKYLSWGAEIQTHNIVRSDERPEIVEKMAQQFEEFGLRPSVIDNCRMVAEEMLMNVLYDAPVSPDGKPLYNHLDRTQVVELKKSERGIFRFACDGLIAAISAEDPFGAFKKEILMKYLSTCYAGKENEMHKGKGGGGLGIHLMIETSDLMVFNIHQGFRTEVIALFNVDKGASDKIKNPSFHLFYR